ncbi:MAG: folate-binding protein YgfZ [Halomonas sp.]|nr:folate-binding protein [Halomonas sp.]MCC5881222.1 folate-binding protein YgfZ [Halomonas sp.]
MSDWITALDGRYVSDERVAVACPPPLQEAMSKAVIAPLVHLGVLDVLGPGAAKLLQGQTSAQVDLADGEFAPLTAFCSAKGRMLANAQLMQISPDRYRLILHRGLLEALRDHLKKFAPFYKSELAIRDDLAILGLIGERVPALVANRFDVPLPAAWHQAGDEEVQLLAHPGPQPRALVCLPQERVQATVDGLGEETARVGNAVWCLHDIQAGLAWLTPTHQDALLPQMINWEALGGVSFKKGCYTGQEVVARAHFRGQVKKRLARARLTGEHLPPLGSAIVDESGKSAGEAIASEHDGCGNVELLAVLTTRDNIGPLSIEGQPLTLLPLPYPIERLDPESLAKASA